MELRNEIKQLMASSLNLDINQLDDDADIRKLEKDSIDVFEMICEIEDHYGVNIPNDDFKDYVIVRCYHKDRKSYTIKVIKNSL